MKKEYNNVDIQVITFDPASKIFILTSSDTESTGGGVFDPGDGSF